MSATLDTAPLLAIPPAAIDLRGEMSRRMRLRMAFRDLCSGVKLWRLGVTLGWLDIKLKYRGSLLGPFWLTLSTGVMVGALGLVYGALFHMNLHDYLPFLGLSLVMWTALSGHISDACNTFLESERMIRSLRMPFMLYATRIVVRSGLALLHNLPVILVVFGLFDVWPGWRALFALPGLALWSVDAVAACLLLGAFCARFRDIPPIVGSIVQIAFFITPIVWKPAQLGAHALLLAANPFYDMLEIVRGPLLGSVPLHIVWAAALAYSAAFCAAAWLLFARVRSRLAFWV